jgi:predicted esterase YcpF (UPF0227 family)
MKDELGDELADQIQQELLTISSGFDLDSYIPENFNLFLSRGDELLDFDEVLENLSKPRLVRWFDDNHRFEHFSEHLEEVQRIVEGYV